MDTFFCQPRREGFLAWVSSDLSPTDRWFVLICANCLQPLREANFVSWADNLVRTTPYIYIIAHKWARIFTLLFSQLILLFFVNRLNWLHRILSCPLCWVSFLPQTWQTTQMPASLHSQLAAAPNASAKRLAKSVKSELSVGDHK